MLPWIASNNLLQQSGEMLSFKWIESNSLLRQQRRLLRGAAERRPRLLLKFRPTSERCSMETPLLYRLCLPCLMTSHWSNCWRRRPRMLQTHWPVLAPFSRSLPTKGSAWMKSKEKKSLLLISPCLLISQFRFNRRWTHRTWHGGSRRNGDRPLLWVCQWLACSLLILFPFSFLFCMISKKKKFVETSYKK